MTGRGYAYPASTGRRLCSGGGGDVQQGDRLLQQPAEAVSAGRGCDADGGDFQGLVQGLPAIQHPGFAQPQGSQDADAGGSGRCRVVDAPCQRNYGRQRRRRKQLP